MNIVEKAATQAGLEVLSDEDSADFAIIDLNGEAVKFDPLNMLEHNIILEVENELDTIWYSDSVGVDHNEITEVEFEYVDYPDRLAAKMAAIVHASASLYDESNGE